MVFQSLPTSPENQGLTQYVVGGAPLVPFYPVTKPSVLSQVAVLSSIPTPGAITDESVALPMGQPTAVLFDNPMRTWMLIYNPTQQVAQIALSTSIAWNSITNLAIGPGEAYFWATMQNLRPIYLGAVWAIRQGPSGLPLWAWDTITSGLGNDGGMLYVMFPPSSFPTNPTGLAPGALYLVPNIFPGNQYAIGVVPGITPNPAAPPVFFSTSTAVGLFSMGGGNLPTSLATVVNDQLWNNGGLVCIGMSSTPNIFTLNVASLDALDGSSTLG